MTARSFHRAVGHACQREKEAVRAIGDRSGRDSGPVKRDTGRHYSFWAQGFLIKQIFFLLLKTGKKIKIWKIKTNLNLAIIYIKMIRELNAIR